MLNLFENYTELERDLEHSLRAAGHHHLSIVLNDDGFLPQHVVSPVGFFTRMDLLKKSSHEKPKFFNDLNLPAYWEIRANGNNGEIFEDYKKKGHIIYSTRPGDYRLIQAVEWLNDAGRVRSVDMYNQNGVLFGRKTFSDGHHVLTTYFDPTGREVLLMNHVLDTIQLNFHEKQYFFTDFSSFVLFYLEVAQLPAQKILYNSLGRPYFITLALSAKHPEKNFEHRLFWQELSQEMPGNMQGIFAQEYPGTRHIVVQNREEYARLRAQVPADAKVDLSYLGYLYDFKREPLFGTEILVHTNSDQLEAIEPLIQNLPHFRFSISARTEMSQNLTRLESYDNVSVFPNINTEELQGLITTSSFYLDINYGGELDNIVRQAFDHHLVLLAFAETLHNARFISPDFVFNKENTPQIIEKIKTIGASSDAYREALDIQWRDAGQATPTEYKEVMQ